MIKIENPKYKSALMTILFYIALFVLLILISNIEYFGMIWFIIGTIAPILYPAISIFFLIINIWQYFNKSKENIYSIIIHSIVFFIYILLIIKHLG